MTLATRPKRLGFFTRLLDETGPAERYRLAIAQIVHAERVGFDSAWVAQHHFHEDEGGLPAPFVFLAQVAARTSRIRLGTGIVTLPLELPVRVAEDAAVLDLMCGGRLEVGVGSGGNLSAYGAFGQDGAERGKVLAAHLRGAARRVGGAAFARGQGPAVPAEPESGASASGRRRSRWMAPAGPAPRETVSCCRARSPVRPARPTSRWPTSRTR